MKTIVLLGLYMIPVLNAQITLPDFFDEEDAMGLELTQPATDKPEGLPPTGAAANDEQTRQMLQHMNMGMPNMARHPRQQAPQNIQSEILSQLLGGPRILNAQIHDQDGGKHPASLLNQTLMVDTGFAIIPIRMHLLASMEALPETGAFRFLLKDSDVVRGRLSPTLFLRREGDGNTSEVIPLEGFTRLEF